MEEQKICRNCIYFPCTKPQCEIGQKGCNDYKSTVDATSKEMENKYLKLEDLGLTPNDVQDKPPQFVVWDDNDTNERKYFLDINHIE